MIYGQTIVDEEEAQDEKGTDRIDKSNTKHKKKEEKKEGRTIRAKGTVYQYNEGSYHLGRGAPKQACRDQGEG